MIRMEKKKIGLFAHNPLLSLALGLTTALAVTTTLTNAAAMGVITLVLFFITAIICGMVNKVVAKDYVWAVDVVIITMLTKLTELLVLAFAPALAQNVGIFLPLLAVNSLLFFSAGLFDEETSQGESLQDGFMAGVYYLVALLVVGFFRELLATGGIQLVNPLNGNPLTGFTLIPSAYVLALFDKPEGALLTVAVVGALFAFLGSRKGGK